MSRFQRIAVAVAAVLGFSAVALGAMAAHWLQLDARAHNWFNLALEYQKYHALAMLVVAITLFNTSPWFKAAFGGWLLGAGLFCGSLYALAFTGNTSLAWITPLGGLSFLVGWLALLGAAIWPHKSK